MQERTFVIETRRMECPKEQRASTDGIAPRMSRIVTENVCSIFFQELVASSLTSLSYYDGLGESRRVTTGARSRDRTEWGWGLRSSWVMENIRSRSGITPKGV